MTLKREIKDAYIEKSAPIYVKTHSNAVYVDDNETETLTQRLDNIKGKIDNNTSQLNDIENKLVFFVEDFGAVGDGVSDDSNAILNAINTIASKYSNATLHLNKNYLRQYTVRELRQYTVEELRTKELQHLGLSKK